MNDIFKIFIKFKKLIQNIQKNLKLTPHRKEWIWTILNFAALCLWNWIICVQIVRLSVALFKDVDHSDLSCFLLHYVLLMCFLLLLILQIFHWKMKFFKFCFYNELFRHVTFCLNEQLKKINISFCDGVLEPSVKKIHGYIIYLWTHKVSSNIIVTSFYWQVFHNSCVKHDLSLLFNMCLGKTGHPNF